MNYLKRILVFCLAQAGLTAAHAQTTPPPVPPAKDAAASTNGTNRVASSTNGPARLTNSPAVLSVLASNVPAAPRNNGGADLTTQTGQDKTYKVEPEINTYPVVVPGKLSPISPEARTLLNKAEQERKAGGQESLVDLIKQKELEKKRDEEVRRKEIERIEQEVIRAAQERKQREVQIKSALGQAGVATPAPAAPVTPPVTPAPAPVPATVVVPPAPIPAPVAQQPSENELKAAAKAQEQARMKADAEARARSEEEAKQKAVAEAARLKEEKRLAAEKAEGFSRGVTLGGGSPPGNVL